MISQASATLRHALLLLLSFAYGFVGATALIAAPTAAVAQAKIVISAGTEGAYYDTVAGRLRTMLLLEHKYLVDVQSSTGSIANLEAITDPKNPVALALTQLDALAHFGEDDPAATDNLVELLDVGKECVFLVTRKQGGIEQLKDLSGEGAGRIAVGEKGSGGAVTWEYMSRIDSSLRESSPANLAFFSALQRLRSSASDPGIKAALLVQRPVVASTPLEVVLDHRDQFWVVPIGKGDVRPQLRSGREPAYTHEEVTLGFGRDYRMKVDTICTRGVLLASKSKLSNEALEKLKATIKKDGRYIAPGAH